MRGIDTLDNGKAYYRITNSENYCMKHPRIDSTNAILYKYDGISEQMVDSLAMEVTSLDSAEGCKNICISDSMEVILDSERRVKTYVPTCILTSGGQITKLKYAWGLGEIYSETSDITIEASRIIRTLSYAKINDIEYGTQVAEIIDPNIKLYPLQIGNKWQYCVHETVGKHDERDTTYYYMNEVVGREKINGKLYYQIRHDGSKKYGHVRIDSTYAAIYSYSDGTECMFAILNGTGFTNDCYGMVQTVLDTSEFIFSEQRKVIGLEHLLLCTCMYSPSENTKYVSGIGRAFSHSTYPSPSKYNDGFRIDSLVYAKIDGVEYGSLTHSGGESVFLSESKLYLFQNKNNHDFADTTWLINKSSEVVIIDSVINNRGYSYIFDVLFSDESSRRFSLMRNNMDTVTFSVNPNDSIRIILSNPDLCPLCDGGEIDVFTDSLQFFTNSKTNSVLLLAIVGDGTLDAENIESDNLKFSLSQNYPNPFNPSTAIKYSIPADAVWSASVINVTLKVYDILGREVATLVNKEQKAGNYEVNFNANELTSGIYFYTLSTGKYIATNKMLLLK